MPNWKKVIVSGSDAALSDVTINDWGSISASLASIEAGASSTTLQDVTDNGNTTTNSIITSNDLIATGSIISNARLGVGTDNPLYTAHFKSGSDAQILIETDSPFDAGLGNVAGIKFKVEDTDVNNRIKGGIFFENTEDSLDYGRGRLLFATNRSGSNTNVSINDWRLKVAEDGDVHVKQDLITSGSISTLSSASIGTTLEVGVRNGAAPTTIFDTLRVSVSQGSSASVISSLNATKYLGAMVDYVIRNSSKDVQRTGNIMISAFNTALAEGITHTETSTPDIGSTTDHMRFSTSITTAGDWTLTAHNDGSSGTWYVYASVRFITAND